MTRVRFTTGFHSDLLRDVRLPLEIRTSDSTLLRRMLSSEEIDVEPGMYVVATKLPAGQELRRVIQVGADELTVELMPPKLKNAAMEVATYLSSKRARLADLRAAVPALATRAARGGAFARAAAAVVAGAAHVGVVLPLRRRKSLRLFAGDPLGGSVTEANVELEEIAREGTVVQYRVPAAAQTMFLQSRQEGRTPVNLALPISDRAGCTVAVHRDAERVWVEVHVEHAEAGLLLGYQRAGAGAEETQLAERLLAGKLNDAIAATIGAYSLLRFGRLDMLHDWTKNLAEWFRWLPDAAAVRGEHLARLGRHQEALAAFVALPGLPIFSDGISFVWERIRLYRSVAKEFDPILIGRAKALHDRLAPFVNFTNFDQVVTTFTGTDPTHPA